MLLADYIGIDAGGKVNALGAAFSMVALGPNGSTAPQHLAVLVDLPSKYAGQEFALSLELREDKTGSPVKVVGPAGILEPLRVQQVVRGERAIGGPGVWIPDGVPIRVQLAMGFPAGVASLVAGVSYTWRVEIDGQHRPGWDATFHVLGAPPPPVFGGQAGPADIPNIAPPSDPISDEKQ